jgi:hypothetical protein
LESIARANEVTPPQESHAVQANAGVAAVSANENGPGGVFDIAPSHTARMHFKSCRIIEVFVRNQRYKF